LQTFSWKNWEGSKGKEKQQNTLKSSVLMVHASIPCVSLNGTVTARLFMPLFMKGNYYFTLDILHPFFFSFVLVRHFHFRWVVVKPLHLSPCLPTTPPP
jgi:hypothetical protein